MRSFFAAVRLWQHHLDPSADIVDIKPANMEELTEVITAAEFHPTECNVLVYSSSKGSIRLCDMRSQALCDQHAKRKHPCPRDYNNAEVVQRQWGGERNAENITRRPFSKMKVSTSYTSCRLDGCVSELHCHLIAGLLFFAVFEEPEDPTNRSFFSEIISSISDVKFSHNGRYLITRDYLSVKVSKHLYLCNVSVPKILSLDSVLRGLIPLEG